jgi:hypothetical protein
MAYAYRTATFDGEAAFDRAITVSGLTRLLRAIAANLVMAGAAIVTVGVVGAGVTFGALWFDGTAGVTSSQIHTRVPTGPGTLTLAGYDPAATGTIPNRFENTWTKVAGGRPLIIDVPDSPPRPVIAAIPTPRLPPAAAKAIPLPLARPVPAHQDLARAPVEPPPVKVAALAPPPPAVVPEKRLAPQEVHNREPALSEADSRTAVYDITTSTVHMPNGQKLEAHSGLYDKMDDPRFIRVRMRGPTPPNVYELTERESLFHGVRAIRLNPVDRSKMFGRDGMLAHSYMLGPNGQSNGCVSFKNYDKFLQAFLRGEVDRLVVVSELGNMSWRTAARTGLGPSKRYASNVGRQHDEPRYTGALGYAPERGAGTW